MSICGVPSGNSADSPFLPASLAAWITWIIDFSSWQTRQILCLGWHAFKVFSPPLFSLIWNVVGKRPKPTKLEKKICQGRTKKVVSDKPFCQSSSRRLISDTCGASGELLNGRSRAVGGCCAWISLSSVSPTSTEFKMWKLLACFPFSSCKSGAQLSHVLGDHPDFHIPEDRGWAEGAGGHCSARIK